VVPAALSESAELALALRGTTRETGSVRLQWPHHGA
jgi:hypothetical protein